MTTTFTTRQAAEAAGLTPAGFRRQMTREREHGHDMQLPEEEWPDQRTPLWDADQVRAWAATRTTNTRDSRFAGVRIIPDGPGFATVRDRETGKLIGTVERTTVPVVREDKDDRHWVEEVPVWRALPVWLLRDAGAEGVTASSRREAVAALLDPDTIYR